MKTKTRIALPKKWELLDTSGEEDAFPGECHIIAPNGADFWLPPGREVPEWVPAKVCAAIKKWRDAAAPPAHTEE